MKLYTITDEYIEYLKKFDSRVYDNKNKKRKYLGIVLSINDFNYYVPMSSPKESDYVDGKVRKSIIPIIRIISNEEKNGESSLKGTLRISNMIPVPISELILYKPIKEKTKTLEH